MSYRFLAVVIAVLLLAAVPVAGQAQRAAGKTTTAKAWTPPRTPDGQPDLQGVWDFRTVTPMERPSDQQKDVLSDQEAAEFETRTVEARNQDRRDGFGTDADVGRAYNDFWWDRGTKVIPTRRTSLVVDPPDGKIPALTADAQKRQAAGAERRRRPAAGPEDRGLAERCILGFNAGPPMTPSAYNNNVQIFQNRDYVVLVNEMVHDARIVPLDGRPHSTIRQWMGNSRGRWEGDTLVVETVNFHGETSFRNATPNLHLTERVTRVNDDILLYEATLNDPRTWTRPWTFAVPMTKSSERMYEYACHEGNYGMFGILEGARAQEKAEAEAAKKPKSEY